MRRLCAPNTIACAVRSDENGAAMRDDTDLANVAAHLPVIELIPTFPLDADRIRKLKRQRIWNSPRLLTSWMAAGICRTIQGLGWVSQTSGLHRLTEQVLARWRDLEDDLTLAVLRGLIDESNRSQDAAIQTLIDGLRRAGHAEYAIGLSRFLLLKQHVEGQLHRDGRVTERKEEVEQLVDSLFREVCREFQQLTHWHRQLAAVLTSRDPQALADLTRRTGDGHRRVMQAYATLYETSEQLGVLVSPGADRYEASQEAAELDRLIEHLREENVIARTVDERLRTELPSMEPGDHHPER